MMSLLLARARMMSPTLATAVVAAALMAATAAVRILPLLLLLRGTRFAPDVARPRPKKSPRLLLRRRSLLPPLLPLPQLLP